jgi:adenosyl cobinamide kinase/adenosyl cobinamide phosphate guanylyltransferase
MILVMGGIASGKRSYVRTRGYTDNQMDTALGTPCPVLLDLDELLREGDLDEHDWEEILGKDVVVCHEVGMGVVPMDASDRAWRERVGTACAKLASEASEVVRVVCGIPVSLKR